MMAGPDPLVHAQALIRCPSVTPNQAGALDYIEQNLRGRGFICHRLPFGGVDGPQIDNLYARLGTGKPHICFAGHVDVVPPGTESDWTAPPFAGEVRNGLLYGRGAADMKGGIAAMMAAVARWLDSAPDPGHGSISFLITADEEGQAQYGTRAVVEWMGASGEWPDHCIVGEPTCPERLGDTIKIGRRGSLSAHLTVSGVQGHVAYPNLTKNPVDGLIAALAALAAERLDEGSADFAPSNLEITSLDTSSHAVNVVPASASARFNVRFNDHWDAASLEARLRERAAASLNARGCDYALSFQSNADVFRTQPGPWIDTLKSAVQDVTGIAPELSTSGGTSDARFIKDLCPVAEFGGINKTIHAVDEHVSVADLEALTAVYQAFLKLYFANR